VCFPVSSPGVRPFRMSRLVSAEIQKLWSPGHRRSFSHVLHAALGVGSGWRKSSLTLIICDCITASSPPKIARQIIKTADLHDARLRKCTPSACDRELLQKQTRTSNMHCVDSTDALNTEQQPPQFAIACSAKLPGHWSSPGKCLFSRAGSLPPLGRFSCTG